MATASRTTFWPGLAVAALVGACSLTVDAGQVQCRTDTDCTDRGGAFAGSRCASSVCVGTSAADAAHEVGGGAHDSGHDVTHDAAHDAGVDATGRAYACIGDNPLPVPTTPSVTFTIQFTDFFYDTPVTTVTVAACPDATDPSCSEPSSTQIPDAMGYVTFTLDTSQGAFVGYFKVDPTVLDAGSHDAGLSTDASLRDGGVPESGTSLDAATDGAAYIPSRIYYSDAPIAKDSSDSWSLIDGTIETSLSKLLQIPPLDPTLGVVLASVVDCTGNLAAGVSASLATDASTTLGFYVQGGTVDKTATDTDLSGIAGFIDVPTGSFTLTTTLVSTHTPIGSLSAYVLPGTITYGNVGPTFTSN